MNFIDNAEQREFWKGEFGNAYVERNNDVDKANELYKNMTGYTQQEILQKFFSDIDKESKIIEIACNVGLKLSMLKKLGFKNLYGIEINKNAYEIAKQNNPDITFIHSSFEDYDPKGEQFDVVCTGGVLIHMNPSVIPAIIKKMMSLSKHYIFGFENYADELTEVNYRGHRDQLWKQNFPQLFRDLYPSLTTVREEKIHYNEENLIDVVYLLKK